MRTVNHNMVVMVVCILAAGGKPLALFLPSFLSSLSTKSFWLNSIGLINDYKPELLAFGPGLDANFHVVLNFQDFANWMIAKSFKEEGCKHSLSDSTRLPLQSRLDVFCWSASLSIFLFLSHLYSKSTNHYRLCLKEDSDSILYI